MTNVWFIENNGSRTITSGQWAEVGISASTVTWSAENAWSVPTNFFNSQQLAILDAHPGFLLGQSGPRIFPGLGLGSGSNGLGSALAYYQAIKDIVGETDLTDVANNLNITTKAISSFSSRNIGYRLPERAHEKAHKTKGGKKVRYRRLPESKHSGKKGKR